MDWVFSSVLCSLAWPKSLNRSVFFLNQFIKLTSALRVIPGKTPHLFGLALWSVVMVKASRSAHHPWSTIASICRVVVNCPCTSLWKCSQKWSNSTQSLSSNTRTDCWTKDSNKKYSQGCWWQWVIHFFKNRTPREWKEVEDKWRLGKAAGFFQLPRGHLGGTGRAFKPIPSQLAWKLAESAFLPFQLLDSPEEYSPLSMSSLQAA